MLTVLFATHNGATTLPLMLKAFCELQVPEGGWKIIAVDNASTDLTAAILKEYTDRLPLETLYCGERGKNRSLNMAIPSIEGELVVLTDDDIIPNRDWLLELEKTARLNPEFDIFGGKVIPHWLSPPPAWLTNSQNLNTSVLYAVTPPEVEEGEIEPWAIFGPNMMVRSKVFLKGYKFNDAIGPAAGAYIMGSETDFSTRLYSAGHRCYLSLNAVVKHIIRPNQMERQWILNRAFRFGRGNHYINSTKNGKSLSQRLFGIERWQLRSLIETLLAALILRVTRQKEKSFNHEWDIYFILGRIYQHFKS